MVQFREREFPAALGPEVYKVHRAVSDFVEADKTLVVFFDGPCGLAICWKRISRRCPTFDDVTDRKMRFAAETRLMFKVEG